MNNLLKIKELLRVQGKTINSLASDLGINRVTLSNILNGNPTLETLNKIAIALNVEIKDLFYSIRENLYKVDKDEFNNYFTYEDENISLTGYLPHLTEGDYGTFKLDIKSKEVSIVPISTEIHNIVYSDKSIEEIVYMGGNKEEVAIQLFYTYTFLKLDEHNSFCNALKLYCHFYKECLNEIADTLQTTGFERVSTESDLFELGHIDSSIWNKLLQLTHKFDLDNKKRGFETFNANGSSIIMYNDDIHSGYNIKMWINAIQEKSSDEKIMIAWNAPNRYDRTKILSKEIFTAKESYEFLHNIMIPKAKKLK